MRMFSAFFALSAIAAGLAAWAAGDDNRSLGGRTRRYLADLIRLDTLNPPGNESKVASYLKQVADSNGIPAELLGNDPKRLNLVARLTGNGEGKRSHAPKPGAASQGKREEQASAADGAQRRRPRRAQAMDRGSFWKRSP